MHRSNRSMALSGLLSLLALCTACPEPQPDACTRIAQKTAECDTTGKVEMWVPVYVAMCRNKQKRSTACAEATSAFAACIEDHPCADFLEAPSACEAQMHAFDEACLDGRASP
jgi:hypothetical protein